MIIRHPTGTDIRALKALWQEAFGDDIDFIDGFFKSAYDPERALLAELDGEVAGALYWLDTGLDGQRLAYLYAIATKAKFRGRGVCTSLMRYTHASLAERGYAGALLVPCEPGLFSFYERLSYRPFGGISELCVMASDAPVRLEGIGAGDYARLRHTMLPVGGVLQENENLDYLLLEYRLYAGDGFILAAKKDGDRLFCAELLGDSECAPGILSALGCSEGVFRTPGLDKRYAMYLPLAANAPSPSYFGFAFD